MKETWKSLRLSSWLSPAGLAGRALLLALLFVICHLLGWRQHTTFLSGTPTTTQMGLRLSSLLGVIYMVSYFGIVLITPVFLMAAGFLAAWGRWTQKRKGNTPTPVQRAG